MKIKNLVSLSVAALLVIVIGSAVNEIKFEGGVNEISADNIGKNLFEYYLFPFEVLALLLTAAVVGAIILAFRESKTEHAKQ